MEVFQLKYLKDMDVYLKSLSIGNEVAEFTASCIVSELLKLASFKSGDYSKALKEVFIRIDELLETPEGIGLSSIMMI